MTRKPLILSLVLLGSVWSVSELFAADFQLEDTPGKYLDVIQDGKIVGRYMYALDLSDEEARHETYKPYLHLFGPDGETPITKGAGGRFTHHRGVFRGWSKLKLDGKSYDTWHMRGNVQEHLRFEEKGANHDGATFTSVIRFRLDDGEPLLHENREIRFLPPPEPAYAMLDVTSTVKATEGTVLLNGDPEHAGLQFRPANEVVTSETRYAYPRENADPHKDLDYPWVAESFVVDGNRYAVVYLNHPENTKGARTSAYRSYGRFGMWFKTEIPEGEEDVTRVRLIVLEGDIPAVEFIRAQYRTFTGQDCGEQSQRKPAE